MIKFKLTKEQKKHLNSILWLYQGARATGRTTMLAYVLIDTVLKTGQHLRILDHHPSVRADRNLAEIIDQIIKMEKLPLKISHLDLTLRRI